MLLKTFLSKRNEILGNFNPGLVLIGFRTTSPRTLPDIELTEAAIPVVHSPKKVPEPQREKVIKELMRMEVLGVRNQQNGLTRLL